MSELQLQAGAGNGNRIIEDLLAELWPSVLETVTGAGMGVRGSPGGTQLSLDWVLASHEANRDNVLCTPRCVLSVEYTFCSETNRDCRNYLGMK